MERLKRPWPPMPFSMDSGAHSMFTRILAPHASETGQRTHGKIARQHARQDFHKSPEFRKYLDGYIEFLHKYAKHFHFYVTLDLIFQPEPTWQVYQELRKNGLKPVPVYHYGEDIKWLERYAKDTDYLGIGGVGTITKPQFRPFADQAFNMLCGGNYWKHPPTHRVHGFAMGGYDLMSQYPWYSVDATTPFYFARLGALMIPQLTKQNVYYDATASVIPVTDGRGLAKRHVGHASADSHRVQILEQYLDRIDITLEDVKEDYSARDAVNMFFCNEMTKQISQAHRQRLGKFWNMRFYVSGNPSCGQYDDFMRAVDALNDIKGLDYLGYLGTFFPASRRPSNWFLTHWNGEKL